MTTRKINTLNLPCPSYSLNIGKLHISQLSQILGDLPGSFIPRVSNMAQVIEVRERGQTMPRQIESRLKNLLGSYIVIKDARPELFLRRDFIKKFVANGKIHLSHVTTDGRQNPGYLLTTKNNTIIITMNAKQYRRFGLVAKKVRQSDRSNKEDRTYEIEIDLANPRILNNDSYQDKMMSILKRLNPIDLLHFRFIPNRTLEPISDREANEISMAFFKFIIEEYAFDGCLPVPLSDCYLVSQKIRRSWLNLSQSHPPMELSSKMESNSDDLAHVINLIDWLGYQLLGLNCDRDEIINDLQSQDKSSSRVDVSCAELTGPIDTQQVQELIPKIFTKLDDIVLRAMILSPLNNSNNSGVVLLQKKNSNGIVVIGMSTL